VNGAHDDMQEPTSVASTGNAPRAAALRDLVARTVAGLGYELVELERAGHGLLRVTLDIAAEAAQGGEPRTIGIEDCERVSRHLTHLFAVEDVDYDRLEVSSPGMDRPLREARDFARFAGSMVKVQLHSLADGRRRLRGRLLGLVPGPAAQEGAGPHVRMVLVPEAPPPAARGARRAKPAPEGETVEFALADVQKARLAPDWEFDRRAMERTGPSRSK
jgi:ribosome maturation factor RimP